MKKNYLLLYLLIAINACFGLFSMEEPIQNWVFIKNMPGAADKEDSDVDWRIKNGKLELNLNATEVMTQQTFEDLIAEGKEKKLPFLLLMVRSGDKDQFTHFFDGSVMRTIMSGWKKTDTLTDPLNKQKITKIEIYVAGDDGKLRLLNANVTPTYLEDFFVDYKGYTDDPSSGLRTYNYGSKSELTTPGVTQALVAGLYQDESRDRKYHKREFNLEEFQKKIDDTEKLEKEEKDLRNQLVALQQQKNKTNEIENIETKIKNITKQIKSIEESYDPEGEKLLQIERLWLSWSLDKFGPEYAQQKNAASARMNEIEDKPHYLQD